MRTYLLVHGAWHGGWCWKRVAGRLRDEGHEVFTPTLTGLGEREHLLSPDIGLDTHIRDVLGVFQYEGLQDVILVGHSYGGMVIAGVADKIPERIAHLVYLDAFVPEDGQSMVSFQSKEVLEKFKRRVLEAGEGYKLPSFRAEAFGLKSAEDLAWVRPRLNPHPFKTKLDPVHLPNPRAAAIARTYISCTDRAGGPFVQFADRFKKDGHWRYREIFTGHDAMITEPQKVAELLLELAT